MLSARRQRTREATDVPSPPGSDQDYVFVPTNEVLVAGYSLRPLVVYCENTKQLARGKRGTWEVPADSHVKAPRVRGWKPFLPTSTPKTSTLNIASNPKGAHGYASQQKMIRCSLAMSFAASLLVTPTP